MKKQIIIFSIAIIMLPLISAQLVNPSFQGRDGNSYEIDEADSAEINYITEPTFHERGRKYTPATNNFDQVSYQNSLLDARFVGLAPEDQIREELPPQQETQEVITPPEPEPTLLQRIISFFFR